ncbi:hypothetical protein [Arthrobacter sp. S39]|uniref:hypothetical protein n=1 Tax=Arthrobacter sp. S39 TaxID=2509720 RepID=UPI001F5FB312|nr:hypothetical protein [Arthrobacter sp. S39]
MVELRRIYWSRQVLRLACSAAVLWLAASVVPALAPKRNAGTGQLTSSVSNILRGMFDAVLAAAALPGLFVVALTIAAVIIRS